MLRRVVVVLLLAVNGLVAVSSAPAAAAGPSLVDGDLRVRTVVSGLLTPTTLAFLGQGDLLVLEKNTGRVQRVTGGAVQATVLDLAVNFGSERGLLGIALHPEFPLTPHVFLYWTESTSGSDTNVLSNTSLLGNRVDRFTWNGSSLTFDANVIRLRARQVDAGQPERGNHNGGVIKFGPDGKLYVFIGDVGRRGQLQNLSCGPTGRYDCPPGAPVGDDSFGGPAPDDAHLTGVILRLNADGSVPGDNPFFGAGAAVGGDVGANLQAIFSYGHRNSFGMDFDPTTGVLWLQENGDDSFSELNRVLPGMNSGWVQLMGPASRISQYREIETSTAHFGLQQVRWPPTNIAASSSEALERLFMLPGAHYSDPELSWKYEVSPGGMGFIRGTGLGVAYDGDLVMGGARDLIEEGHLFRIRLTPDGQSVAVTDPALADGVADNVAKWDISESESLLFGSGFGVVTDVRTGPDGDLYVVSLTHGAIYAIGRAPGPRISTEASPDALLGAPVRDVATLSGGAGPTGTVTFRLFRDHNCTTEVFTSTNPVVGGTTATSDWFTPTGTGTYYWTAVYNGDANNASATSPCREPNESVTISTFAPPPFTLTITGDWTGPVTVNAGESVLVDSGRVAGPVTVNPGGALTVVGSKLSGGITADRPAFFSMCGTEVSGPPPGTALRVTNAAVPIRVGDPAAGCAGNRFAGQVELTDNLAVTFGANAVSHHATVDGNGPGNTVIKANNVLGTLGCTANNPPPTNAGQPNTAGSKTGQCAGL